MGLRRLSRRAIARVIVPAVGGVLGAVLVAPGAGHAGTVTYQYFTATGPVSATDSTQASFTLASPSTTGGVGAAEASDGSLVIQTQPTTKYWSYDSNQGAYVPTTYATVIQVGTTVEAAGKYSVVNGQYTLLANYVWSPPPATTAGAPNPKPSTVQDYTLRRTFAVTAQVIQTGTPFTGSTLWSTNWGFVLGTSNATFVGDSTVPQIALAHNNSLSIYVDPTTHYELMGVKSTRDQVVTLGATLFVGGHYAWAYGDWRFVATYIFNGAAPAGGAISFYGTTNRDQNGTSDGTGGFTGVQYDGYSTTGDGQLNPGAVSFANIQWDFDGQFWVFSGNWMATHNSPTDHSSIGGTVSGTWDPTTQAVHGSLIIDDTQDTGLFVGLEGGGSFNGDGVADLSASNPPTTTLEGQFNLTVTRN